MIEDFSGRNLKGKIRHELCLWALTSIQHTEWTEWTKRMSEATVCMKVHHKIDSYSMKIILF